MESGGAASELDASSRGSGSENNLEVDIPPRGRRRKRSFRHAFRDEMYSAVGATMLYNAGTPYGVDSSQGRSSAQSSLPSLSSSFSSITAGKEEENTDLVVDNEPGHNISPLRKKPCRRSPSISPISAPS